jgi:hypothetical protein
LKENIYFGSTILKVSKIIATVQIIPRIVDKTADKPPIIFQNRFGPSFAKRIPG